MVRPKVHKKNTGLRYYSHRDNGLPTLKINDSAIFN